MNIKHTELEIDCAQPFKNCKLGRERNAQILTKIISGYKDGFVLALNSEWGSGKTTFTKMWQQQLKNLGYETIYFNAWENDLTQDPLIALMSELKILTKNKVQNNFKSLINKASVLTKNVLPGVANSIAKRYLDSDSMADLITDSTKGAVQILADEIETYTKRKQGLVEFKKELSSFVLETTPTKPLIFFIDELDRCRPNYSVEVLEQVKHFFSVSGIVFVLSIDKEQLSYAVRGVYGNDHINSDEYLRRFIDVEYTLPMPNTHSFCTYLVDYFDFNSFFSSDARQNYGAFKRDKKALIEVASVFFEKSKVTLRQQEKIFAHARIGFLFFKSNQYVFPEVFVLLVFFRIFNKPFYLKLRDRVLSCQKILDEFVMLVPLGLNDKQKGLIIEVEAYLICMYNNSISQSQENRLISGNHPNIQSLVKSRIDSTENVHFKSALEMFYSNRDYNDVTLDFLLKKIDLVDEVSI